MKEEHVIEARDVVDNKTRTSAQVVDPSIIAVSRNWQRKINKTSIASKQSQVR